MSWSKKFLLLAAIIVAGCQIDSKEKIDQKDLNFSTTDDSELFFKNVRQLYYDLEEIPAANLNVYRIKERTKESDYPLVNLAIVWNWLKYEAYIIIEPNELITESDSVTILWSSRDSDVSGTINYELGNSQAQLTIAKELYNGIISDHTFEISLGNSRKPFLDSARDREAFRKTMADYFRLTRTFDY